MILEPGVAVDAAGLWVDAASGTGSITLGELGDAEVGVWEMAPGIETDTEADEVFVVIAGRGRVEFVDPPLPTISLSPGTVVRLTAGMRTVWTVTETLRKVYLTPGG